MTFDQAIDFSLKLYSQVTQFNESAPVRNSSDNRATTHSSLTAFFLSVLYPSEPNMFCFLTAGTKQDVVFSFWKLWLVVFDIFQLFKERKKKKNIQKAKYKAESGKISDSCSLSISAVFL